MESIGGGKGMSETGSENVSQAGSQHNESTESSKIVTTSSGASSGISGEFQPVSGDDTRGHEWSFNFNKAQNEVDLTISLNSPEMLLNMEHQYLNTTLTLDDINQLIIWLFQVKNTAKKAMEISTPIKQSVSNTSVKGGAPAGTPKLSAPIKR
ncbi:hypothetical protein [uncultured Shewanella sp.]|uniref:hypothetical protein n=1 Tax=uncultured Shewanella sp. TaxID=173975 RepID=UPI00260C27C1|nr:hypothetical protein [uncultured Shewanella sp.]